MSRMCVLVKSGAADQGSGIRLAIQHRRGSIPLATVSQVETWRARRYRPKYGTANGPVIAGYNLLVRGLKRKTHTVQKVAVLPNAGRRPMARMVLYIWRGYETSLIGQTARPRVGMTLFAADAAPTGGRVAWLL